MNEIPRKIILTVAAILAIFLTGPNNLWARDVTIVGEINDQQELVSSEDGTIYRLVEGEVADELVNDHVGEKVKVFGKLIREVQTSSIDELPKGLIDVISFEDVPE